MSGDIVEREGGAGTPERMALVGISQGTIVALDSIASGRWQAGALGSFAGLLPPVPVSTKSKETPVSMIHGADDRTIPAVASTAAAAQLRSAGFNVDTHLLPSTGHIISPEGAGIALAFLKKLFAG